MASRVCLVMGTFWFRAPRHVLPFGGKNELPYARSALVSGGGGG